MVTELVAAVDGWQRRHPLGGLPIAVVLRWRLWPRSLAGELGFAEAGEPKVRS